MTPKVDASYGNRCHFGEPYKPTCKLCVSVFARAVWQAWYASLAAPRKGMRR